MILAIIISILISIALGYITKYNVGIFAMIFAYVIGAFFMDLTPKDLISFWPISIFFVIFAVSLFYNFAIVNGTLEKFAMLLMYKMQKFPYLILLAIFAISALIAALGAGFYTVLAFMAPLSFLVCQRAGINQVSVAMAINYGALGGANFMTSQSGIIFRGLMEKSGIDSNGAFSNSAMIFLASIILPIVVLSIFTILDFRKKITIDIKERPDSFDSKQKMTLVLMFSMIFIVLLIPLLSLALPHSATLSSLNKKIDIGLIAMIFVALALLLKLGDEKSVIALIPWNTLIMICGVGMLIAVAIKAGTIDLLSDSIKQEIPSVFIPIALCLVAAIMSLFSSTLGVVTPALFPIVPSLASGTSFSESLLFTCIVIGAQASAISPFSSGGSLILGAAPQGDKERLFKDLLTKAVPIGLCAALLCCMIISYMGVS